MSEEIDYERMAEAADLERKRRKENPQDRCGHRAETDEGRNLRYVLRKEHARLHAHAACATKYLMRLGTKL